MKKVDEEKLHGHGDATISLEQRGKKINIRVKGTRYDLLHLLIAVISKNEKQLGKLIQEAVLHSAPDLIRGEIDAMSTAMERMKARFKKKERSIH